VQWPGQQQPGQQCQQQPAAGATGYHVELANASSALDAQSFTAKPAGSHAKTLFFEVWEELG
jgi:hypothetical protein